MPHTLAEEEEIRLAAWRAVSGAGALEPLAREVRERKQWTCSQRTAESIVSKWLSPDDRRPLPGYLLVLIERHTGVSEFGPVRVQAAPEQLSLDFGERERRGPVKVERDTQQRRDVA